MYITRHIESTINDMLDMFKVILVTGPRQVGKTTMLRHVLADSYNYVSLDDANQLAVALTDPGLFFMNNPGKLIIDEVQYAPNILQEIKKIVDSKEEYGTIVLTGSQNFSLMENVSESLAGRVGIVELAGLSLREIQSDHYDEPVIPNDNYLNAERVEIANNRIWETIHRGSLPELYKKPHINWQMYYGAYTKTYIERDVRMIINVRDLNLFSRFLIAMAARTGQLMNYNSIAKDLGIKIATVKNWAGILESSGLITFIQPFSNNRLTRTVKTPMMYFMDTGLVCYLLGWLTPETLMNGAMSGPILETFVVSEIVKSFKNKGVLKAPLHFYRDRDMREIDLIVEDSGTLYPIEIKKTTQPKAEMGKNFDLLKKADGFRLGKQLIFSFVDRQMHLDKDILAYPISKI